MSILDEILAHKRGEVARAKSARPAAEVAERAHSAPPARGFRDALAAGPGVRVVAEIKQRSPSKGLIREDFDVAALARSYAGAGAAAISVLTDEHFFGGHLEHLARAREATEVPLLRKDFVLDAYQLDEARAAGADAALLIVAALEPDQLAALHRHAETLGLDVLVEVHDQAELEIAAAVGARVIGINNRNLRTFETDLATTERLAPQVPDGAVVVAESGIFGHDHVERLRKAGADAFLVGESLMRRPDVGQALRELRGES